MKYLSDIITARIVPIQNITRNAYHKQPVSASGNAEIAARTEIAETWKWKTLRRKGSGRACSRDIEIYEMGDTDDPDNKECHD